MTVINDYGNRKIWNNPGIWSQYNIGAEVAPTWRTRSVNSLNNWTYWPGVVSWYNSPEWYMWTYQWNVNNIKSNYNVNRLNHNQPTYYTWRYAGRWGNYNYNYSNWYNNSYGNSMSSDYSRRVLDRAVTDANAWYNNWTADEIAEIRAAAKQNPAYAKQLANAYNKTGSFYTKGQAIDYGIPQWDSNGNYVRENLNDANNPQVVPWVFTRNSPVRNRNR